mmetsp:Transcript_39895/g.81448  ORF Transcript_39895/g.81448 Transcript_39895/m.81448 type:complete len:357 (-) Transcript_39895:130-1200(-)
MRLLDDGRSWRTLPDVKELGEVGGLLLPRTPPRFLGERARCVRSGLLRSSHDALDHVVPPALDQAGFHGLVRFQRPSQGLDPRVPHEVPGQVQASQPPVPPQRRGDLLRSAVPQSAPPETQFPQRPVDTQSSGHERRAAVPQEVPVQDQGPQGAVGLEAFRQFFHHGRDALTGIEHAGAVEFAHGGVEAKGSGEGLGLVDAEFAGEGEGRGGGIVGGLAGKDSEGRVVPFGHSDDQLGGEGSGEGHDFLLLLLFLGLLDLLLLLDLLPPLFARAEQWHLCVDLCSTLQGNFRVRIARVCRVGRSVYVRFREQLCICRVRWSVRRGTKAKAICPYQASKTGGGRTNNDGTEARDRFR